MLEGGERAGAVAIELAVPTVVQAQNVAAGRSFQSPGMSVHMTVLQPSAWAVGMTQGLRKP